eukprot:TRINITY_DN34153_c0_g2_i2.p1 TRINITY_DN34153_c0_g2~~TRINITY_DN34153_c0_g2_i2.p1  ORF type:complete len:602 (-),score=85.37 TRINITY_DN34153_c0_g2_i2:146-1951(-)
MAESSASNRGQLLSKPLVANAASAGEVLVEGTAGTGQDRGDGVRVVNSSPATGSDGSASQRSPPQRSRLHTASPALNERLEQYDQHGAGRRPASPYLGGGLAKEENYMHAKMKYHRALVTATRSERVVRRAAAQANGEEITRSFESTNSGMLDLLHPPPHVLPHTFFVKLPFHLGDADGEGHQGSLGFIFTVMNTMMGSTLMTLPWGFNRAGLIAATVLTILFGVVSFYTCGLIMEWGAIRPTETYAEFADLCELYLGQRAKQVANLTSIFIIVGAAACYHVLMSTNLQAVVESVLARSGDTDVAANIFCCGDGQFAYAVSSAVVGACMLAMLAIRDISKLVQMGSYGVLALVYNVGFLVVTAMLNIHDAVGQVPATPRPIKTAGGLSDIGVFVGMMGLSLFVHSVLLPIAGSHVKLKNQPAAVKRDLGVAYMLTVFLYVLVGAVPAMAFQLGRGVIPQYASEDSQLSQNILLDYPQSSTGALVGRAALVLQLGIVYPILCAVMRKQFFAGCLGDDNPSQMSTLAFNMVLVAFTTTISAVYPSPGSVVGYVGMYTAIVYILWLPVLVHLRAGKAERTLFSTSMNLCVAIGGTVVVLLQFLA